MNNLIKLLKKYKIDVIVAIISIIFIILFLKLKLFFLLILLIIIDIVYFVPFIRKKSMIFMKNLKKMVKKEPTGRHVKTNKKKKQIPSSKNKSLIIHTKLC